MIRLFGFLLRLAFLAVLLWGGGFVWYVATLPKPADKSIRTDGIVVLTGGPGRLARGIALLRDHRAERLLVSGVDPSVRAIELAAELKVPEQLFDCCVDLGRQAADTIGNGQEAADWVRAHNYRSIRLVTSAYHTPRARLEIETRLGGDNVEVIADPVPLDLPAEDLAREFSKYALRVIAVQLGATDARWR